MSIPFGRRRPRLRRLALRPGLGLDCLEKRELLASLALTSAEVRPDGRTIELKFNAPLPDEHGTPDWMPGSLANLRLTSNSGLGLEQIGTVVTTAADRLTWTSTYLVHAGVVTFGSTGLTLSAGEGLLQDADGNSTASFTTFAAANHSLVDADGFTTDSFTRGVGGVTLYVSSTYGSDNRSFLQAQNAATPYKTPANALRELLSNKKSGTGSAIRLLRGDTLAAGGVIKMSGQDAAHPFIIEDYWHKYTATARDPGTRPVIQSTTDTHGLVAWGGYGAGTSNDHVVIRRIALTATKPVNRARGMLLTHGGTNWTIDDVAVRKFQNGIVFQGVNGPYHDVTILRTNILDSWTGARPQGLYTDKTNDLLISQSVFDTNGRTTADGKGRDMFSHNIYIQHNSNPAVVWGNVIRAAGSHGIQMRSGGVLAYNYLGRNALAASVDGPGGSQYKNVVDKAEDISPTLPRGFGLSAGTSYGSSESQVIEFNLIVNSASTSMYRDAISLHQTEANAAKNAVVRHNTVIDSGAVNFRRSSSHPPAYRRFVMTNNLFDAKASFAYVMPPSYTTWGWYKSNRNLLATGAKAGQHNYKYLSLAQWKAATGGSEADSITGVPVYRDAAFDLGSFYRQLGGTQSEAAFASFLRDRGLGRWDARHDTTWIHAAYAAAYRPTNQPGSATGMDDSYGIGTTVATYQSDSPGSGTGRYDYYGASDHR